MECQKCGSKNGNVKKNGRRKDGEQRYYCHDCHKTFSDHKPKRLYSKIEKRLLTMLVHFLEFDSKNSNIKEHLKNSKKYNKKIENIEFISYEAEKSYEYEKEFKVDAKDPRLLICQNKNSIKLVKLPRILAERCENSFYFWID